MSLKIEDIEGIGPVYGGKLRDAGVNNTDALLKAGATAKGRKDLESKTGIEHGHILKWVNMADLFRIKGVAGEYAELLEAAGVDTVKELRNRNAANLTQKMKEVNDQKHLVRQVPSENQVTGWIDQAKQLPPIVTY